KMNYDDREEKANYSIGIGKYGAELVNILNVLAIVIDKENV
ncbi:MAG: hypothetical protein K0R46_1798, partial [Herbinix sp.]|nr:hypothetical protein [Herbinix sp.]